ncbi:ATP synthase subunit I [Hydrogenophaga sp.]|uniref:ATP synthase subunit I n=1 Tax=Hydrogenophaga sp. TaxID=1904254 RepID=UPI00260A1F60|nr:ATP synthase subunit I [Hydrogenophaga sp.]MCW5655980.1 ATP synthase subunit I [Hydrogenophaga sp.]
MTTKPRVTSTEPTPGSWEDGGEELEFKPLSHEEALRWRATQPRFSPWTVVGWQVLLAVLVTVLAWFLSTRVSVVASVSYGAAVVLVPTALMAWGMTSSALSRLFAGVAKASLAGFFLWEGVKLLLALAMLWSAPRIVTDLNWLALVAGLVVVLKAYWLGLLFGSRRPKSKL